MTRDEVKRAVFVERLAAQMDEAAEQEYGPVEREILRRAMATCGMTEYPDVSGNPSGERASIDCVCERCRLDYGVHPLDWRVIGHGNVPFLHILCDGRRVKL